MKKEYVWGIGTRKFVEDMERRIWLFGRFVMSVVRGNIEMERTAKCVQEKHMR